MSYNQNCFVYSIDHNDILDHIYCTEPGNLFNRFKYHVEEILILN